MTISDDSIRIVIPPSLDGITAEQAALRLSSLPPEAVAAIMGRGGLWLDGQREPDGNRTVAAGSLLQLRTPPGGHYRDAVIDAADVLYEDDWLLVLNKRPGWYVSATPWDTQGNVQAGCLRYLAARDGQAPPLHLAHQLDRDTSGVLVLSKHPAANRPLHRAFAERLTRKRYLALCTGIPEAEHFSMETGLGRGPGGGFYVYPLAEVGSRTSQGRPAVSAAATDFELLERLGDAALLEARPITGRTHQIRLHLAHRGHPLLGDARYGGPCEHAGIVVPHHMLHAARLELPHPQTGQPIIFEATPPESFTRVLEQLRH